MKSQNKIVIISEQQEKFLREQRGILFEYYTQVSEPRKDANILGNLQVWIYGDDRNGFTPHCHIMTADRETEFEISLIDWSVINVKSQLPPTRKMKNTFAEWLETKSNRFPEITNKVVLYRLWDGDNPNNSLADFCKEHNITPEDKDLLKHIED